MYLRLWFDTRGCCPGRELHDIKAGRSQQGNRLPIHGRVCLFLLGSVPAYVNAVGATADSITYFIGSIFFTAASFNQLLQACRHDRQRQHGQYDPDWGRQRLLPADE